MIYFFLTQQFYFVSVEYVWLKKKKQIRHDRFVLEEISFTKYVIDMLKNNISQF